MITPKRIAIGAAALAATTSLTLLNPATAGADPKNGYPLDLTCDDLGVVEVVLFSSGSWSAGLVVQGNQTLIPYEFHFEGTFTPTGGEPQFFVEHQTKPAPHNGRTDRCTLHEEEATPDGTFEVDGEVRVSYTPRR